MFVQVTVLAYCTAAIIYLSVSCLKFFYAAIVNNRRAMVLIAQTNQLTWKLLRCSMINLLQSNKDLSIQPNFPWYISTPIWALIRSIVRCVYVSGFQKQVLKHAEFFFGKDQKKHKKPKNYKNNEQADLLMFNFKALKWC